MRTFIVNEEWTYYQDTLLSLLNLVNDNDGKKYAVIFNESTGPIYVTTKDERLIDLLKQNYAEATPQDRENLKRSISNSVKGGSGWQIIGNYRLVLLIQSHWDTGQRCIIDGVYSCVSHLVLKRIFYAGEVFPNCITGSGSNHYATWEFYKLLSEI